MKYQVTARKLTQNDIIAIRRNSILGKPKVNHFIYFINGQVKLQVFKEREYTSPNYTSSNPPMRLGLITSIPKFNQRIRNGWREFKKYGLLKFFIDEIKNPYITIHVTTEMGV